jgi:GT2 family glycosyltransferase
MDSTQKTTEKPHILIAVPTMGEINTMLVAMITKWIAEAFNTGDYSVSFYPTACVSPVDRAREEIVDVFLQSKCTHLFWIDSDTVPKPDALKRLLAHDADIVSGLTPIIIYDEGSKDSDSNGFKKKWNCVGLDEKHLTPNTGVHKIFGAGGSCIMVKRAVYEAVERPCYKFITKDAKGEEAYVSEDIYFCLLARTKGFEPICDTSIIAAHYKGIFWDL